MGTSNGAVWYVAVNNYKASRSFYLERYLSCGYNSSKEIIDALLKTRYFRHIRDISATDKCVIVKEPHGVFFVSSSLDEVEKIRKEYMDAALLAET